LSPVREILSGHRFLDRAYCGTGTDPLVFTTFTPPEYGPAAGSHAQLHAAIAAAALHSAVWTNP